MNGILSGAKVTKEMGNDVFLPNQGRIKCEEGEFYEGVAPLELEYSIHLIVFYKCSAPTELECFASLSDIQ